MNWREFQSMQRVAEIGDRFVSYIDEGEGDAVVLIHGIRAGLCHDTYSAHQGVEHDDMNILVLGARVIGTEMARELVRA